MDNRAIGILDSGVGGLTVAREIYSQLSQEDIVYFGDTAYLPYGPKSSVIIQRLVRNNIRFLLTKKVKAIVLACHTASALALEELKKESPVPIIGVIRPGAEEAMGISKNKRIGVIGTYGTIRSGAYTKELKSLASDVIVKEVPCPLFVPLVEEGWTEKEVTRLAIKEYLTCLKDEDIDVLILGCTHYPLLKPEISRFMGETYLVDSARATVAQLKKILKEENLSRENNVQARHSFFVSDAPQKFARVSKIFLDKEIESVERVEVP
jgi:glutamate racemase